jgi:hypothetical protein
MGNKCGAPGSGIDTEYYYCHGETTVQEKAIGTALAAGSTNATPNALVQQQYESSCNTCRNSNAATTVPYSYIVGSGAFFGNTDIINAPTACNSFLVGATPDCPTAYGTDGSCAFSQKPALEDVTNQQNIQVDDTNDNRLCDNEFSCPSFNYVCTKLRYDTAFKTSCCLGQVTGLATISNPATLETAYKPVVEANTVMCDYRWCPLDPWGTCEDVFLNECAGSASSDGKAWTSALLVPNNPCNTWYQGALQATSGGEAPLTRWAIVDQLVERYCANPATGDTTSCACFDFVSAPDTQLYTSYSGGCRDQNLNAIGVCPVQQTDAETGNTLNISDYACIAPECNQKTALLTSDVWGRQQHGGCPNICMQIVTDGNVVVTGDSIQNGLYVNNTTMQCGGPQGSMTTTAVPVLASLTDRINVFWPHYVDNPGACPTQPQEGGGCTPQPVAIAFALDPNSMYNKNGAIVMPYNVTFSPDPVTSYNGLYSDIVLANGITGNALSGTLSNGNQSGVTNEVVFYVNVNASSQSTHPVVPPGEYPLTVTIQDTDPLYSSVFRSVIINTQVYETSNPAPPQGPPAPSGGQGPPIIYDKSAPTWMWYVLGAVGFVLLLLFLHCVMLLAQKHTLQVAVRDAARSETSLSKS